MNQNELFKMNLIILRKSFTDAFPIMVGYFSISIAFGMLAKGFIESYAVLMSLIVFAGASQFIALQLFMKNSSGILIVITTFVVNLRHTLMSSYFSPLYSRTNVLKKAILSFGITDETFAIASRRLKSEKGEPAYHISLNFLCYVSWVAGTIAGLLFGSIIPPDLAEVLPFTLTALFISILVLSISNRFDIYVGVLAGILSLSFSAFQLPTGWNVLIATVIACITGGVTEKWMK